MSGGGGGGVRACVRFVCLCVCICVRSLDLFNIELSGIGGVCVGGGGGGGGRYFRTEFSGGEGGRVDCM